MEGPLMSDSNNINDGAPKMHGQPDPATSLASYSPQNPSTNEEQNLVQQAQQDELKRRKEMEAARKAAEDEEHRRMAQAGQGGGGQNPPPTGFKLSFGEFMFGAVVCAILGGPFGLALFCGACLGGYGIKKLFDGGHGQYSNRSAPPEEYHTSQPASSNNGRIHHEQEHIPAPPPRIRPPPLAQTRKR